LAGAPAELRRVTPRSQPPPLHVLSFLDRPEPGDLLAVTYGLSVDESELGRPELLLCVHTDDPAAWALGLGEVARALRGRSTFRYGETVDFGFPISERAPLSGFVCYKPSVLDKRDARVPIEGGAVHLVQLYPLHAGELRRIRREGIDWLFGDESVNFYDLQRSEKQ
jgi:hypothetical protein